MPDNTLKNTRKVIGPVYVVRDDDDVLNCDTTLGPIQLVLANIRDAGLMLSQKTYYINDTGNNAAVNNIVIVPSGDQINGGASVAINVNGGSGVLQLSGVNEWLLTGDGFAPISDSFVFHQTVASNNWVVDHFLGKKVSVDVTDDAFNLIQGEVIWNSNDEVTINFNSARTGWVFCN